MDSPLKRMTPTRPSTSLHKPSVIFGSNPDLPNSNGLFVQQAVANLPQKLNLLSLEGQLDPHELIILQKALMLLEIELSFSPLLNAN